MALGLARRLGMKPLAGDIEAWLSPAKRDLALTFRENKLAGLVGEA
jgi:hypothetical protein